MIRDNLKITIKGHIVFFTNLYTLPQPHFRTHTTYMRYTPTHKITTLGENCL